MKSITVRVRLDSFDFAHPREKQTQVYVHIEDVARASYLLDAARYEELRDAEWGDALDRAHELMAGWVSDSRSAEARAAVRTWLESDENRDALNAAWFADRAKRDPVARALMADLERLQEQLAAAQAKTKTTRDAVLALHPKYDDSDHCRNDGEPFPCTTVRAVGGPAVDSATFVEALHASSGAVIPIAAPYREVWDSGLPPGGYVCSVCGQPVESEPCPDHAPKRSLEDPHDSELHHDYRLPRDLPEVRS